MRTLFNIVINPFMSSTELTGITLSSNRWQVLAALVAMSECFVNRVIETPRGFLLAGSVPGQPNTAGIYVYDEPEHCISQIGVGEATDDFSEDELDQVLPGLVQMLRELPMPVKTDAAPRSRNRRRRHHRYHNRQSNHNQQKRQPQKAAPSPGLAVA